jgi:hypothetical protein
MSELPLGFGKPYLVKCRKCKLEMRKHYPCTFLCPSCRETGYNRTYYRNKKLILERDNYQCQCCKTKDDLIAHHIDCKRSNNSPSNLITLCRQCHDYLHHKYTREVLRFSNIYTLFPKIIRIGFFGKRFDNIPHKNKTPLPRPKKFFMKGLNAS